ncbi:hypothetical protein ACN20G_00165 [Streptomyces sp. BI20]|uniref:hypothetical protein n=1 Tax=Streptomyces sp. BI20 TaxID=3403460 RepID=UPI003C71943C
MTTAILVALVALALVGLGCVLWAEHGGPRWTTAVARATLAAGTAVRVALTSRSRRNDAPSD